MESVTFNNSNLHRHLCTAANIYKAVYHLSAMFGNSITKHKLYN